MNAGLVAVWLLHGKDRHPDMSSSRPMIAKISMPLLLVARRH